MEKVYARRLLKLADFLDKLPRKKFNFSHWVSDDWKGTCGTTACALGWACSMPEFRRLGARLTKGTYDVNPHPCMVGRESSTCEEDVASEIFGLDIDGLEQVFVPGDTSRGYSGLPSNATPKQVAKHIRKYVNEH